MPKYDNELTHLIAMSGLQENYIASELNLSHIYFSQIKSGTRRAVKTRARIKTWLVDYIKNYTNFKRAA